MQASIKDKNSKSLSHVVFFVCFFRHDDTSAAGKTNEVLQKKKTFFSLSFLNSLFVFPFTFGQDVLNVRKMTPPPPIDMPYKFEVIKRTKKVVSVRSFLQLKVGCSSVAKTRIAPTSSAFDSFLFFQYYMILTSEGCRGEQLYVNVVFKNRSTFF